MTEITTHKIEMPTNAYGSHLCLVTQTKWWAYYYEKEGEEWVMKSRAFIPWLNFIYWFKFWKR